MYEVGVRDHVMIAHSFQGELFGPAQRVHGATYVVDVVFRRRQIDDLGLAVDIAAATQLVRSVLSTWDYRNLDDVPQFEGANTTTEFMAHVIFTALAERIRAGELGEAGGDLTSLKVTLHESHVAWASYEGELP